MPFFLSGPVRRTLSFVVLCAMAPALCIIVGYGLSQFASESAVRRDRSVGLAQNLAALQGQFAADTRLLLTQLASVEPIREMDARGASQVLAGIDYDTPLRDSFFLVDTSGRIIASNRPQAVGLDVSDRKYFREAMASGRFSAGEFVVSRSGRGETQHFSLPVRASSGQVVGVLASACNLSGFNRLFEHVPVPTGTVAAFVDHRGLRLYRYPPLPSTPLGQPLSGEIFEHVRSADTDWGVLREKTTALGEAEVAFVRLRLEGANEPYMTVLVATPVPSWGAVLTGGLGRSLALFFVALALALLVARRLGDKALVEGLSRLGVTAERISGGDLAARCGPLRAGREVQSLALAMDQMAESLERELARRTEAEAGLRASHEALESRVDLRTAELTRTLEALRRSESLHRAVFEGSPLGMAYVGSDGGLLKSNFQFQTLRHRLRLGDGGLAFPEGAPLGLREALAQALSGRAARYEGAAGRDEAGRTVFARALLAPVRPGDNPGEVIALVEDTTRERERSDELRGLWAVVERCPASILITGPAGDIEYVNPYFTEVTGYEAREVLGRNPSILQSGEHGPEFFREMWQTLRAGKTWRGEFHNRKKSGHLYWEDASISPVMGEDGQVSHYIAVKEDITARKRQEADLRAALEDFESLFSMSAVAIAQLLPDRQVNRVNSRFEDLFGYAQEEVIRSGLACLHQGSAEARSFEAAMLSGLAREGAARAEQRFLRKSGEAVWCQVDARAQEQDRGGTGTIWVFTDISASKQLDNLRQDMERVMRHDLKAPLTAVISYPDLVLEEGGLSPGQTEALEYIREAGRRMLFQIDMSLDLYKMETGAYRLEPDRVDLVRVAQVVLRDLATMARDYAVELILTVNGLPSGELPPVWAFADAVLCRTMLANLVQNAVEACRSGSAVLVALGREEGFAQMAVRNPGQVPEDFVPVFFDKYATLGKKRGTGLGTYSARLMAEVQGGGIALETGQGFTTVRVRLPVPRQQS